MQPPVGSTALDEPRPGVTIATACEGATGDERVADDHLCSRCRNAAEIGFRRRERMWLG